MVVEANNINHGKEMPETLRRDCIYDDELLGFEKDPMNTTKKMKAQYPFQDIDLGDGSVKRLTCINAKINSGLKTKMIELVKEFKDCFAWDYNEMPRFSRKW
ncbi:hypothetical protein L195_g010167 [Trifolium pratense]|uniref:Uncharacterized protein n=1 Tax=Trifolium pratense TaxID=57577 RepID=A0A2K3PE01_TRIPR|nr:hypothetical protein L195_g010167 [Trifolium pratense]